jgi:hypothetical protein
MRAFCGMENIEKDVPANSLACPDCSGFLSFAEEDVDKEIDKSFHFGSGNPARTLAQVHEREKFWATTSACEWVNMYEILGWTRDEYKQFEKDRKIPERLTS